MVIQGTAVEIEHAGLLAGVAPTALPDLHMASLHLLILWSTVAGPADVAYVVAKLL